MKKSNITIKKRKDAVAATAFVLLGLFLVAAFLATKPNPYSAELRFSERSILGGEAGSVLPASCDSNPTYDHTTGGTCPPPTVQLYFR